jgi:L-rhamnose mutarotase
LRVALHTRILPEHVEAYEAAHREVPEDLAEAIRAGGATSWTIWRSGTDLFHLIECEDYAALIAHVGAQPANAAWQVRMADLVEGAHDYSTGSGDAPLPVVWELSAIVT